LKSCFTIEVSAEPRITPPIKPTPKPAGIDVDAIAQNNKLALGDVNDKDCNGIGSKSSKRIKPVPAQDKGINNPIKTASIICELLAPDL